MTQTTLIAAPKRMVELTIDSETVRVLEGSTILDACRMLGNEQPTPQYGHTESTCLSGTLSATSRAGISAPVGQACTHSPQATQVDAPIASSMSNTIFSCWPR